MKNILTLILVFVSILGIAQSPTVKDIKVVDNVRFITNGDTLYKISLANDTLIVNADTLINAGGGGDSPFISENSGATLKDVSNVNNGGVNLVCGTMNIANLGANANILNGQTNTTNGQYNIITGIGGYNFLHQSFVLINGDVAGSSTNSLIATTILNVNINDSATANLSNSQGQGIEIPSNYICIYDIQVVAIDTADLSLHYANNYRGKMINNAGTLTNIVQGSAIGFGSNTAGCEVTVEADDVNDRLQVQAINPTGRYMRYVANLRLTFLKIK
jgi:hypothetical protein